MKFSVETWAPEYGIGLDPEQMEESTGDVNVGIEVDADDWIPQQPESPELADSVLFVDGVRRIDARIWISDGELVHAGVCASVAAGAVKCDQREAHVVDVEVKRGVFASPSEAASRSTQVTAPTNSSRAQATHPPTSTTAFTSR